MFRKRIRLAAVGVLMITLTLAAAPAQASGLNSSWTPGMHAWQTVRSWLINLWPGALAPGRPAERDAQGLAKGSTSSASGDTSATSTSFCDPSCERGGAIDPNG
jgi:hypothetical protein